MASDKRSIQEEGFEMRYILAAISIGLLLLTAKMMWDKKRTNDTIEKLRKDATKTYEKRWNKIKKEQDEKKYNDINNTIGRHTITIGLLTKSSI